MHNQKFNKNLKKLTALLISSLTNFKEGSENHESCMEFSLSNFLHHRFLEADSHKITKQLSGMCEKFNVHAQPIKSTELQQLLKKFLENDLSKISYSNSQVHYSLLEILLQMSVSPVNATYSRPMPKAIQYKRRNFDWGAYLLSGEDKPSLFTWDESPMHSEDEDEDFIDTKQQVDPQTEKKSPDKLQVSVTDKHGKEVNLVTAYWKANTILLTEQSVLKNICSLCSPTSGKSDVQLTEWNIMREVIWLLSGRKSLFVFPEDNNKHCVSSDLLLSHQTKESVQQMLQVFNTAGNQITKLKAFIFSSKSRETLTYEAYAASLLKYFKVMSSKLLKLESSVVGLEDTLLLDDLKESVAGHIAIIDTLSRIYDCSISMDNNAESPALHASRLLNVLYASILDEINCHNLDSRSSEQPVDVLVFLWLGAVEPYIDIIDKWIGCGELDDPRQEFVLRRSPNFVNCQEEDFWKDGVSLVTEDCEKLPWLHAMWDLIITGGKSMEIVKTLVLLTEKLDVKILKLTLLSESVHKERIYNCFFKQMLSIMCNQPVTNEVEEATLTKKVHNKNKDGDILLCSNFNLLCPETLPFKPKEPKIDKIVNISTPFTVAVHRSLHQYIELKCNFASTRLLEIFRKNYGLQEALDIFHNFHFMGWGDVMHDFCTTLFLDISQNGKISYDIVTLNIFLHEAIGKKISDSVDIYMTLKSANEKKIDKEGLFPSKAKEESPVQDVLKVTDDLQIEYEVKWPLTLVLTKDTVKRYQAIFSYLLQIKRAVTCVELLKLSTLTLFSDETAEPSEKALVKKKCHHLAVLRSKILHVLKHWHSFVMTSVIQSERHSFTLRMQEAKSLDDILLFHHHFLSRICTLCLLDNKVMAEKLVSGTLKKLMTQAINFCQIWKRGATRINMNLIKKHELDFDECSEFLGRILKTIAERGAVPILDSLAYSILPPSK